MPVPPQEVGHPPHGRGRGLGGGEEADVGDANAHKAEDAEAAASPTKMTADVAATAHVATAASPESDINAAE